MLMTKKRLTTAIKVVSDHGTTTDTKSILTSKRLWLRGGAPSRHLAGEKLLLNRLVRIRMLGGVGGVRSNADPIPMMVRTYSEIS